jgi:hypothetical protein
LFDVGFCSSDGRWLTSVALHNADADTDQLKEAVISRYGQPASDVRGVAIWNDKKSGNAVTFVDIGIGVGASIEYKPLGDAAAGRLY